MTKEVSTNRVLEPSPLAGDEQALQDGAVSSATGDASPERGSEEASRRAAAILEVLAGVRGPSEAAAALRISVNHYYLLERKALAGLVSACEPQPKGPRGPGIEQQLARLERELDECRRECLRQAALVRATQRAVGLPLSPPAQPQGKVGKRKGPGHAKGAAARRRRPTVRALRAAHTLRQNSSGGDTLEELKPPAGEMATNAAAAMTSRPNGKEASHDDTSR